MTGIAALPRERINAIRILHESLLRRSGGWPHQEQVPNKAHGFSTDRDVSFALCFKLPDVGSNGRKKITVNNGLAGGHCRDRTYDLSRVKGTLSVGLGSARQRF